MKRLLLTLFSFCILQGALAEDGSRLWLRQATDAQATVTCKLTSETAQIAQAELEQAWKGVPVVLKKTKDKDLRKLPASSYRIRAIEEGKQIEISSLSDVGLLYGAYHLLRLQATNADVQSLNITESPAFDKRILNHWDNLDRRVERGYAGFSLWNWEELPALSPRYKEYARANASIGINGTVLNNVNASPKMLTTEYLEKVKVLADVFRPYGIQVYLSVNFATPMALGEVETADPLNKEVVKWWKNKVKEIYQLIPDFGGFLVKANSEGQPGPCDFGRTHAEGANMLADALKPYKGIVMWRAFVYSPSDADRAKQAYLEFQPLDGQFRSNVIIQVKNGPIDFQPREPYSPLFTSMKQTPLMPELQITQEYLGHSNHLAFLAPMWEEFFDLVEPNTMNAIAGVTNIGTDTNWCGHHFGQANWYAFGRLAWEPTLTSDVIAKEWLQQTFDLKESSLTILSKMMVYSHEAVVDYMMPLGLHHIFAWGHHYGPEPWCAIPGARADWMPSYYHNADEKGLGFDRSSTGSNAVAQYPEELCKLYDNIDTCPEKYILWFHHVPWQHKLQSGRTLWEALCYHYDRGVQLTRDFQKAWDNVKEDIDAERFADVQTKLIAQTRDAIWWKDACLLYFQTFSKLPFPKDYERPIHELDDLKKVQLGITNEECPTIELLNKNR